MTLVLGSQGAWFACVLGAAQGLPWLGVVVTAVWVAVWAGGRGQPRSDLGLLAGVAAIGVVADAALVGLGAFGFPGEGWRIGLSPAWMVALWVSFGTTLRTLGPALGAGWTAALVGAVAGAVAYSGGVSFGAARFGDDVWGSRLIVAAVWAAVMPALVELERRIR